MLKKKKLHTKKAKYQKSKNQILKTKKSNVYIRSQKVEYQNSKSRILKTEKQIKK